MTCAPGQAEAAFHPARPITDEDVEHLVRQIRSRMLRYLRKTGKLTDHDAGDVDAHDASLFDTLRAASIAGRTALGPRAGRSDPRIGQGSAESSDFARGRLCANLDGFSLHAAVRVDGCNSERLERLCRYALRPPIVHERLSLTSDGKVLCKFKRRWRDGSTHVVLDPITLIERLTALIPAPRKKLVSYHGVFAPAFPLRHTVVPPPQEAAVSQPQVEHSASPGTEVVVRVLDGRYGPYVTDGETNATVPKDESPDSMTMARALEPIEARAARGPAKKKGRRSAGAKKPPARKKCAPRSSPLRPSARPDASPRVRKPRPQAPTLAADLRVAATEPAWLRARPVVR